ncbi:hypothetical protein SAMN05444920_113171 [Nonomuraea solani]|uniref:Lipoprotein LprG n=1 Tax=Nonomuraea solani TaxID=1144553 RepID=A0A1H6ERK0_9ACTN|nr:hypothetical protein [Nonomuraea solani]SEG99575.1 hypothetical protein SAMN05444920_113171 [Nonomuraea solani]
MKRILAGLALASSAALITATPAQAAPADPSKALKKQYVAGHGVRFSEAVRTRSDGKTTAILSRTGTLEFGKKGVVAGEVRAKGAKSAFVPPRMIVVGGSSYAQGDVFSQDLPEGKKWVRYPGQADPRLSGQPLDIFEPKVLKTLVSQAKSFKGGTYRGSISFGTMSKLYGETVDKKLSKIKISYALGVDSKGLVTGIRSEYTLDFGILGKSTSAISTRFTGWGAKITIKAPPADEVIDFDDLGSDSSVPQEIPDGSLNSFGGAR